MGRPCPIMVESSGMDIWNPPSPTSAKTSLSGRANCAPIADGRPKPMAPRDRKSTRLNSSHLVISYAVFCLKKKQQKNNTTNKHLTDDTEPQPAVMQQHH